MQERKTTGQLFWRRKKETCFEVGFEGFQRLFLWERKVEGHYFAVEGPKMEKVGPTALYCCRKNLN